ncbi:SPFH domain-containing protein [Algivirga pacifica]|uniref:SPFH domain-containing protein n=1 Tax=Algivirga pacifica TaxID=1162670 RepID=A0ABP9DBW8_9BACT
MIIEKVENPKAGLIAAMLQAGILVVSFFFLAGDWQTLPGFFDGTGVLLLLAFFVYFRGYMVVQPGEARLLLFLGEYKGTVLQEGFYWTNPFMQRKSISMKERVFHGDILRVYDKKGLPIDVSASVTWKIGDTAKAVFEVEDLSQQVESSTNIILRVLAETYVFDNMGNQQEISMKGNTQALANILQKQLGDKLAAHGVIITDARLKHLSYAPEIASDMLKVYQEQATRIVRQQQNLFAVELAEQVFLKAESKRLIQLGEPERSKAIASLIIAINEQTK